MRFKRLPSFALMGAMLLVGLLLSGCNSSSSDNGEPKITHQVLLKTSEGDILLGLYGRQSNITVANFVSYVESGFYDGLLFHRVIEEFMIQGGWFDQNFIARGPLQDPILNESDNGLSNLEGTIAMARTPDPDSAQSQFFINTVDNPFLDYQPATSELPEEWGYAVFGHVLEGMDVVRSIEQQPTTTLDILQNYPITPVIIYQAQLLENL